MTRVKVCGLRRPDDVRLAAELGAWAAGFIFHPPSPRCVSPEAARSLVACLPEGVLAVGVFVDRSAQEVQRIVDEVGLGAVQLHGNETPELALRIRAGEVWKALRVGSGFRTEELDAWSVCDRVLLDTYRPERPGGTGATFDWSLARAAGARRPVILAGGLRPENVGEAIAAARPEAVDVASGVEASPGVKSPERLRALFAAVEAADAAGGDEGVRRP